MALVILSNYSPQILSFHKSMYQMGLETGYLCIKAATDPEPVSKYFQNIAYINPKDMFTADGLLRINAFLKQFESCGFMCVGEKIALWLWENRPSLPKNCSLLLPNKNTILNVLSKTNQLSAAIQAKLPVLSTYEVDHDPATYENIQPDHFPLCLRPCGPGAVKPGFKVVVVSEKRELASFIRSRTVIHEPIIAQPFLNLPNLVVHGSRVLETGESIGLQGFLVERKFEGLTLTIKPVDMSENLKKKCIEFTEHMGIVGPYHFEFLIDPETEAVWFLELNNRLGGTTAKVFGLGYDEPGYLLQSFGYDVPISGRLLNRTASSKIALLKYLYFTLTRRITPLDYPANETGFQKVMAAFKSLITCRDDILSLRDLRGTVSFYKTSLMRRRNF